MAKYSCIHRFWIDVKSGPGFGVTARSEKEAIELATATAKELGLSFDVIKITSDIDVSTLDENQVLPKIGPPSNMGVWFPRRNI